MARITISDDLSFVASKYELGMLAGQRVRDLNGGEQPTISIKGNDKAPVLALREIASGNLDIDALRREFIQSYKKMPVVDEDTGASLESSATAPELKELDAELSGDAAKKEEIESEAAEDLEEESEGTAEAEPESAQSE